MINTITSLLQPLQRDPENEELEKTVQRQISSLIVQHIKTTESPYHWEEIKKLYNQPFFWEPIENEVRSKTDSFLALTDFRKLPSELKTEYTERIFDIIYKEHENLQYAAETLDIEKKLMDSIFRLLTYCEDMIVIRRMSKRRFTETLHEITGIAKDEMDNLWDLYQEHSENIESFVHSKRLFYLERKINSMNRQMARIIDYLDYISDSIDFSLEDDDLEQ